MAFWNDVSRKVTEKSQEAINYGKNMADTVKLNSMIAEEEKKIDSLYCVIGKKYVEKYNGDYDADFREELLQLKKSMELVQEYKNQIYILKGTQVCEKCGAEISRGSVFCSNCGNRMPELKTEQFVENGKVCPKCGATVQEGDMFCMGCGSKIEPPETVNAAPEKEESVNTLPIEEESANIPFVEAAEPVKEEKTVRVCRTCNAELGPEDVFCVNCGTKVVQ